MGRKIKISISRTDYLILKDSVLLLTKIEVILDDSMLPRDAHCVSQDNIYVGLTLPPEDNLVLPHQILHVGASEYRVC